MTTATTERPKGSEKKSGKTVHISELRDEYLACRDLRHMWGRSDDWNITRNTAGKIIEFTRRVVCMSCKTERHETIALPTYDVVRRYYVYPPGFLLLGSGMSGSSHSKTQQVRKEMIHRLMPNEKL